MAKAMDLFMWDLHFTDRYTRDDGVPAGDRREGRGPSTVYGSARCPAVRLRRELDEFAKVYNAAWSENWDFVPYTKADLDHEALNFQLVFDRDWFMVAEIDGQDRGGGDHDPGHEPGAGADEWAPAAVRMVALPQPRPDHRPSPDRVPRA